MLGLFRRRRLRATLEKKKHETQPIIHDGIKIVP